MPFPPNLYLIGAQKAGTTYLANLLGQHQDVCLAEPKEPHFFTQNRDKDLAWYEQRFSTPTARHLLDASPSYSAAPLPSFSDANASGESPLAGVPRRMHELSPEAKIIYVMRNPVRRTYSSYWHNVRAGHESLPFREAIAKKSFYLRVSHFYEQLALYLEYFPRDSMLLLLFEELVRAPAEILGRCFEFLDVDPPEELRTEVGRNTSFAFRPTFAALNRALSGRGGLSRVLKPLRRAVPDALASRLGGLITQRVPRMEESDRRYLTDHFQPENEKLARELGLTLTAWQQT